LLKCQRRAKPASFLSVVDGEKLNPFREDLSTVMLCTFFRLTAIVAIAVVALIVLAFVLKIVVFAAIVAAIGLAALFIVNLFRRRRSPISRYPS
jgi:hypothetical protein